MIAQSAFGQAGQDEGGIVNIKLLDISEIPSNYTGMAIFFNDKLMADQNGKYILRIGICNRGRSDRFLRMDMTDRIRFETIPEKGEIPQRYEPGYLTSFPMNYYPYKRLYGISDNMRSRSIMKANDTYDVSYELPTEFINECSKYISINIRIRGYDVSSGCNFKSHIKIKVKVDKSKQHKVKNKDKDVRVPALVNPDF